MRSVSKRRKIAVSPLEAALASSLVRDAIFDNLHACDIYVLKRALTSSARRNVSMARIELLRGVAVGSTRALVPAHALLHGNVAVYMWAIGIAQIPCADPFGAAIASGLARVVFAVDALHRIDSVAPSEHARLICAAARVNCAVFDATLVGRIRCGVHARVHLLRDLALPACVRADCIAVFARCVGTLRSLWPEVPRACNAPGTQCVKHVVEHDAQCCWCETVPAAIVGNIIDHDAVNCLRWLHDHGWRAHFCVLVDAARARAHRVFAFLIADYTAAESPCFILGTMTNQALGHVLKSAIGAPAMVRQLHEAGLLRATIEHAVCAFVQASPDDLALIERNAGVDIFADAYFLDARIVVHAESVCTANAGMCRVILERAPRWIVDAPMFLHRALWSGSDVAIVRLLLSHCARDPRMHNEEAASRAEFVQLAGNAPSDLRAHYFAAFAEHGFGPLCGK